MRFYQTEHVGNLSKLWAFPPPMPRYFFHMHFDGDVARDPIGIEIADLDQAIAQAKEARAEIMAEEALDRFWLEIMDERGRILAKVG